MNRIKTQGLNLYAWFWWHTEFWVPPQDRRPYTFIMRDIYHSFPLLTLLGLSGLFYAFGRWWLPISTKVFFVGFFSLLVGVLLGHLFWGNKYVPGQQEQPEYNPSKDNPREFFKSKL